MARYVYYEIWRYAIAPFLESSIIILPEFFHHLSGIGKLQDKAYLLLSGSPLFSISARLFRNITSTLLDWSLLLLHGDKLWLS